MSHSKIHAGNYMCLASQRAIHSILGAEHDESTTSLVTLPVNLAKFHRAIDNMSKNLQRGWTRSGDHAQIFPTVELKHDWLAATQVYDVCPWSRLRGRNWVRLGCRCLPKNNCAGRLGGGFHSPAHEPARWCSPFCTCCRGSRFQGLVFSITNDFEEAPCCKSQSAVLSSRPCVAESKENGKRMNVIPARDLSPINVTCCELGSIFIRNRLPFGESRG